MNPDHKLLGRAPHELARELAASGIRRFCFVTDERGRVQSSHPELEPAAEFLMADERDFRAHEGLFFQVDQSGRMILGAFVHKTCRGQAAGGVRYWRYDTFEQYLRDGLRLAEGMTRKNALAGLWWGGGKGVIAHDPKADKSDPAVRAALYREYGDFISSLRGCYVTAEDVGTHVTDMAKVFAGTRFTTCIPQVLGGSGNPSVPTARGVVAGMEAALEFLGHGSLAGKTVAVQGMGNVGRPLIEFLFEKGVACVKACDIDPAVVGRAKKHFSGRHLEAATIQPGDDSILASECDVVAPCATGAVMNPRTIPQIKARVVCGAANNQLEDGERDDRFLHERGITYVPDFLTNRMGIVNCANEQYGYVNDDPAIERHLGRDWEFSIHQMTQKVLAESAQSGRPPAAVALNMADRLALEHHPIFGHRGQAIVRSLWADRWHDGKC
jgi:glutamate dehydrogenase/leucine dehydrogenase